MTGRRRAIDAIAVAVGALLFAACATTGSTFRSGVGERYLEEPPYYAGASISAISRDTSRIGHLPIAFQRGATQPASFDPRDGSGSAIDELLEEMNAFLDSLGASARLVEGRRVSAVAHEATTHPPDVRFGCLPEPDMPGEDCAIRGDSALGRGHQAMRLSVGRPSKEWITWMRGVTDATATRRVLVITLEVGQYLPEQRGFRGTKVVELGSGYTAKLPWLTALETPLSVLQLTGAVVDRDGRAVRIGAEGVFARRTRLLVSTVGAQERLSDEDVEAARTMRRDDLPGHPVAWRVALRELVTRLTGAGSRDGTNAQ